MDNKTLIQKYDTLDSNMKDVVDMLINSFTPDRPKEWITVPEAAAILGVSSQTMRTWIKDGEIPTRNVGVRKTTVERRAVERLAQLR